MQRRFKPRKRVCSFCAEKVERIDYKDINVLKKYITDRGNRFYQEEFLVTVQNIKDKLHWL